MIFVKLLFILMLVFVVLGFLYLAPHITVSVTALGIVFLFLLFGKE